MSLRCSSCGAEASGKFCSHCGAPLAEQACAACGKANAPGARFCAACGAGLGGARAAPAPAPVPVPTPAGSSPILPIALAGFAVIAAILVFVFKSQPAAPPPAAAASAPFASGGGGTPPDLSTMTPRDQFLRLHDRVMTAAEQGDTATFNRFSPMALMAYQNLPEVDPDVRYHAATLRLHTGDIAGAKALADTITAGQKNHLFGFMLRAAIARFEGNKAATAEAYRGYLAALDAELKAARPEYGEHQSMLDNFTQTARAGVSAK